MLYLFPMGIHQEVVLVRGKCQELRIRQPQMYAGIRPQAFPEFLVG